MAAGLLKILSSATAGADCLVVRQALSWRDTGPARPSFKKRRPSEPCVAASSGVEAAHLRLEREERRAWNARRDHAEDCGVCRFLDDDPDAIRGNVRGMSRPVLKLS